jgi:hypothetical protein
VLVLAMILNPRFKGGTQRKEQRSGDRACDSDSDGGALTSVVPATRVQESKEKDPGEDHQTPMIV